MKNRFCQYAVVAGMGIVFFAYYQFQSPYLETDGYYHSKMAYLMRESGWIQSFKWAHCSFWRDRFSDKEWLFHVYLIPFTLFPNVMTGAKIGIVLLASGVLVSFLPLCG
ncbi:MAG: hypothetical protein KatS3mg031_0268 [Chitinophagales bacterium]|nr:MAG: hypothetical protein KatS3mg031_0268 [Chitinophagales bacterium]